MSEAKVWVFFYGSFINREVLAAADFRPDRIHVARLDGYEITLRPLANVVHTDRTCVYGIACQATHAELARLYGQSWVGTYLPEAVLVETQESQKLAALCYVAPNTQGGPADDAYVDRIVGPAREYGFPQWYIDRLESFRPAPRSSGGAS